MEMNSCALCVLHFGLKTNVFEHGFTLHCYGKMLPEASIPHVLWLCHVLRNKGFSEDVLAKGR